MLFSSVFIWTLLGVSLITCTLFLNQYVEGRHGIVQTVFGTALLASLGISGTMTVLARRFAIPRALNRMLGGPYEQSPLRQSFHGLAEKMGVHADLEEALGQVAFSVSVRGRNVVAVSDEIVRSLTGEETEAVLAHELSHIKNRDSLVKGLARLARLAFPFDPMIRLLEAALHRERELLADHSSVNYTNKPLALASALLKACKTPVLSGAVPGAGLCIGGNEKGLFNLYPDLETRIDILVGLAKKMNVGTVLELPA